MSSGGRSVAVTSADGIRRRIASAAAASSSAPISRTGVAGLPS